MRETVKRYRLRNKERLQQRAKLWRENNKDKVKEQYERRISKDNFKEQSKKWRFSKNNKCIDCGNLVCDNAIRCGKCFHKNRVINSKETIICLYCKKPFVGYKKKKRLYCSKICYINGKVPYNKGKTFEEMYGEEKANKIKNAISEKKVGVRSSFYGKHHTESAKKKVSIANKGEKSGWWGKHHTEITKDKIRKAKKGKTFEELYGIEIAEKLKANLRMVNIGKHLPSVSEKLKKLYSNPINHPWYGRHHTELSRKKDSASKQGISFEKWEKFISFEPYTLDFNKVFKELIRQRDNYTCQLCNLFEEDCIKLYKRKLTIHHIDYIKLNSFPQNCISLCTRCNFLVNKDREIWIKHFQELLKKLYGYEYTEDQKVILDFIKKEDDGNE